MTLTRAFAPSYSTLRMLDPADPNSHVGPVIHAGSLEKIEAQVAEATAAGAVAVAGGKRPSLDRCALAGTP